MSISVLLVESDPDHAQAVVQALSDAWLGWRVVPSATVSEALEVIAHHRVDVVLMAQRLTDGTAYDVLAPLRGVPALIAVPQGAEADAALAMRHGFADFVVRHAHGEHLLTLPAQIEAVLERAENSRARLAAEQALARQHRLLQAITRAQSLFIAHAAPEAAFDALLQELMDLTDSQFGLMGPVHGASDGSLRLELHAWLDRRPAAVAGTDAASMCRPSDLGGMACDDPDTLIGQTLMSGQPQIRNHAPGRLCSAGLAERHGPLSNFLGLPILAAGNIVAFVGLADRPGGYPPGEIAFLAPLLNAVAQLELARRAAQVRESIEAQLAQTSKLLAEKTQALEVTLASVSQGISNVDAQGRILVYNQRYLELLDLPESLLAGQPLAEDVIRFQAERGDFGDGFALFDPQTRRLVAQSYAIKRGQVDVPDQYVRRTHTGRYIEVRTRFLPNGTRVRTFTDVTDYLGALEALRESEERWRSMTKLSSDWYWEQDADLRFVRVDAPSNERQSWLNEAALLGRRRWEFPDAQHDESHWRAHRAQLEARETFHDFEICRVDAEGREVWLSVSGEPIFDDEGGFRGYRGVARDITERKRAEAEIQRLAFYDELTGLPNRRLLLDRIERVGLQCERERRHAALLFLDLDDFKHVSDTLGHEWGDSLLVQASQRLGQCVRASDTVARLGGDEFVVVLAHLHARTEQAASEAEGVGLKILAELNRPYWLGGVEAHSTVSIGLALFADRQQPVLELLKRADLAMYQAKAQGRNTLCFYDPAMQAAASARSALEADIRRGLQRGEFLLHYQPVVDACGQVQGAEALVRWSHPQRGLVPPGDFIPVAEQTGLIVPLGRQVLGLACAQLAQWAADPVRTHWHLAVNVSAQEFRHPDFVGEVLQVLQHTGADARRLTLELTESLLLHDVEDSIAKMQALRERGVGFSLDDFGTGYSSLSYLKRLPLDQLKIDQGFVRDVLTDPNDAAIACTIVALAQSLGLEVVAEGVETDGQRDFLLRNGCRQFQGYLFGPPAALSDWALPTA
ncbi:MAG: EAL domain-containing protein [Burkholderiaceae bacterium]